MAGEKLQYTYSGIATGATHVGKEGCGVVINGGTDGIPKVVLATDGVKIDGVILRGDEQDKIERIGRGGIMFMKVGANIAAAGEVQVNATGCIITKAAGVAVGKVFAAAALGDLVPVFVY